MHQTNKRNQDLLGSWDSGVLQVSHFPALRLQTCCLIFFLVLVSSSVKLRSWDTTTYMWMVWVFFFLSTFFFFFLYTLHFANVLFLVRTNWGSIETHLCKLKKKKTGEIKRLLLWSRIVEEKTHTQGENEGEKKERRGHEGREDERGKRKGNNCLQGLPQWFSV